MTVLFLRLEEREEKMRGCTLRESKEREKEREREGERENVTLFSCSGRQKFETMSESPFWRIVATFGAPCTTRRHVRTTPQSKREPSSLSERVMKSSGGRRRVRKGRSDSCTYTHLGQGEREILLPLQTRPQIQSENPKVKLVAFYKNF